MIQHAHRGTVHVKRTGWPVSQNPQLQHRAFKRSSLIGQFESCLLWAAEDNADCAEGDV